MAAFQQLLLAIGERLGELFLEPERFQAVATATSNLGYNSIAQLTLIISNSGNLDISRYTLRTFDDVETIQDVSIKNYNWLTNGAASLYSVKIVTAPNVDFTRFGASSDLINTWRPMDSTRSWTLLANSEGSFTPKTISFTVQIAATSDLDTILEQGDFRFICTAETISDENPNVDPN